MSFTALVNFIYYTYLKYLAAAVSDNSIKMWYNI